MCSYSGKLTQGLLLAVSFLLSACLGTGGGAGTSNNNVAPAAAPAPATPAITSVGTDFYLTLPDHLCVSSPASCLNTPVTNTLTIAAAAATTGNVVFNGVTTPFSVAAGAQTVITLDPAVVVTTNETIEAKAVHVTSVSPVSVYVVSENQGSADGYMGLPTPGLGTDYYAMSYASAGFTGSEFAVVATQATTTVTITPTAAGASKPAGAAYTVVLNAGDTYQLQNPSSADMTGSHVTSDKPIAVFSGHRCTDIPTGMGYCDYLVEELTAVSAWGKTFHTAPFSGRARYTVRVMASQAGTTITTVPAGLIPGTLNAGQFADVTLTGNVELVSSAPVQVAQYMRGYADDAAGKGDPSMVMVTPAEMGMSNATFGVHGLAGTSGEYINVVTETSALANLKLDNVAVNPALFAPIGGTSIYSVGTVPVAPGVHALLGSVAFSALVYDYGTASNAVSYAYPAATVLVAASAATTAPGAAPTTGCTDVNKSSSDKKAGGDIKAEGDKIPAAPELAGKVGEVKQSPQGDAHDVDHVCH